MNFCRNSDGALMEPRFTSLRSSELSPNPPKATGRVRRIRRVLVDAAEQAVLGFRV